MKDRSGNQAFHFSGTIAQPNGQYNIFPITLYDNQNIHAELIGPSSADLNYDLRLYEMDVNTGTLTSLVDICAYGKGGNATVLPQTVATVNRNGGEKNYALVVYALTGYSSTDTFDVNITLGIGGDSAEANDNAFTAYSIGEMGINGLVVTGTKLDSPKDVDWFVFTAPDMSDFEKMKLDTKENPNVKFQLYRSGGGTSLIEVKPTNGIYSLQGVNYLRVTDSGNDFSAGDIPYKISTTASFKMAKSYNEISMNGVLDLPTQTYKVWNEAGTEYHPEKRTALLGSCRLEWKATFLSKSGYVCKDVVDTLHIRTTNLAWTPEIFQSASADGVPAVDGVATCVLDPSVGCRGTSIGENMDFDEPCTLNMWSDKGFATSTEGAMPIFVTSRIMG